MREELTTRQLELLTYLECELKRHRRIPSLRNAGADLGISHAAVLQLLKTLEDKRYVRREGPYSRTVHLLNRAGEAIAEHRSREIPIIGRIAAGLPIYAQQEWAGTLVVDAAMYRKPDLFALRIKGDSMREAGILDGDLVICEPRQFAEDGEIVVALVHSENATVKRFYLHKNQIELRPANKKFKPTFFGFDEILIQGKVVGVQRGPESVINS